MPDGALRYGRDIEGSRVYVNYRGGFTDFEPFMAHASGVRSVRIDMTGDPRIDFPRARAAAVEKYGKRSVSGWTGNSPRDWSWHHNQDQRTMQLIPTIINNSFDHIGGAAIVRRGRR